MKRSSELEAWFVAADRVLLGFSGGVDSSVLAVVGARILGPARFLAVIGRSPSYPDHQWQAARDLARRFEIPVHEVDTLELADPSYRANGTNRCYFCKVELWTRLGAIAAERGLTAVIDGTNADDLSEHRPGAVAGAERGIRSPLVELGWTKDDVRSGARELGLPNATAPAAPCLSSRIRYGLEVTADRLRQVELAEEWLRSLGVTGSLRVRHHAERARVEVEPPMFGLVDGRWNEIERRFRQLGFVAVDRDPAGYRRGSLLPVAP
jgi:uncharacterized protein